MKDIIWTLIFVWLIYKFVELFKTASAKKSFVNNQHHEQAPPPGRAATDRPDIKNAVRNHINKTGEYVDFEEIK